VAGLLELLHRNQRASAGSPASWARRDDHGEKCGGGDIARSYGFAITQQQGREIFIEVEHIEYDSRLMVEKFITKQKVYCVDKVRDEKFTFGSPCCVSGIGDRDPFTAINLRS
jgi:hypothetical protein